MAAIHNVLAGGAGFFTFTFTISSDTSNYNLSSALLAAGWDGNAPVLGSVTINNGIVVSASTTANAGFTTGASFQPISDITITNNGYIVGMGGKGGNGGGSGTPYATSGLAGGTGLAFTGNTSTSAKIKLYNNNIIAGGGGGGGGAQSNAQGYRGPGGGGGRTGRTNSAGGDTDYGSNQGTFNGPGAGIAPTGNGNSGGGGGWGSSGAEGSVWPGDYKASDGGPGGNSITGYSGFTVLASGTLYGSTSG
jgi:hypothetical protein